MHIYNATLHCTSHKQLKSVPLVGEMLASKRSPGSPLNPQRSRENVWGLGFKGPAVLFQRRQYKVGYGIYSRVTP